jgi:ligand-binding sensor domain-containing protein/two-component sensor histidine kinase
MRRVTVFLVLFIFAINGLSQKINFKHLSIQDGLSQSTINCIFQDSRGFMWFGTQDGLNKYDGYNFTVYKKNPADTNSISHNWIWDIFEDIHENLWIATWNGLTKFNPATNQFFRFFPDSNNANSISGARPSSICHDNEGNLWIGIWGGGLNKYIFAEDKFVSYQYDPQNENSIPNNFVRTVYSAKDNVIWVGTWGGLSKIKIQPNNEVLISNYKNDINNNRSISCDKITSIMRDKSGILWIGTLGGGVNQFNESKNEFNAITNDPNNFLSISHDDVSFVFEDKSQNLWIGTIAGGLNKIDQSRKIINSYSHEPDNALSLISDKVYSIYEDNSGLLWIGSNGLNIYNKNLEKFSHIHRTQNLQNSLNNNKVWAFYEDKDKNIWIGSEGGLNKYEPQKKQFYSYKHIENNLNSLSNDNVNSIVEDLSGNLWIGTRGGGLNKFDPNSGIFSSFDQSMNLSNTDGIDYIMSLCIDENFLWIATYDKGLIKYDINHNNFFQFIANPKDENSIPGNYLRTIFKDSHGNIWIGGWGQGLCRYDRDQNQFIRFLHDPGNPNSLISNIVHSIYEYNTESDRILCVGTNNGLSYLDLEKGNNKSFDHISENDGLAGNVIYSILSDNSSNLWISTNKGLSKFNIKNRTFRNYTFADGLQSNEFNASACLKRTNGQLLYGGVNGFNMFFPDSVRDNLFLPPVVITSFKVFDKPFYSQGSENDIHLSYDQIFFSFEFAALDYSQPGKNQYAYKMEGFDKDWIYSGTRRYVSYTNLDAGDYTFVVKGTNSDGIWVNNPKYVDITISPPYWQTWWFRLFMAVSLILIVYVIFQYRLAKLLEIERLRVRIASDLHDDIGSALTRISVHSEIIKNSDEMKTVRNSSRKIGLMSREIITTMSDIIWSIDARNDLIKNLIDRMKDFSTGLLVEKDIQLKFTHKGLEFNKKLPIHIRQNLFLIFKEAINNIYKHSSASVVKVNLNNTQNDFIMKIADDGEGFNPDMINKGNGLKNIQMRAERIGAQLEMNTNDGVEIILTMKKL